MKTISEILTVKDEINLWKKDNLVVGLVPTMGALHAGHESLIKKAKETCDRVIVSIFVNPIQFGPKEDYNIYPRILKKDQDICDKNNVDIIFHPEVKEMYPDMDNLTIVNPPDSFKNKLCGLTREGHFDGVATVVLKLFNIIQPDKAYFGQKDFQQLIIIKKLCRDLNISAEIIGCPIIREKDGLALSSRNQYLSTESRKEALILYKILQEIYNYYISDYKESNKIFPEILKKYSNADKIEYLKIYEQENFKETNILSPGCIVVIAAKIGGVRLIDNIILE